MAVSLPVSAILITGCWNGWCHSNDAWAKGKGGGRLNLNAQEGFAESAARGLPEFARFEKDDGCVGNCHPHQDRFEG
jgi:hypothetical protein